MSMVVGLASAKHSPGVTTLAQCLAALGAEREAELPLVLEADPSGGDIAAREGLAPKPGLKSLIIETRHGSLSPEVLVEHAQLLGSGGLAVLATPLPFIAENIAPDALLRMLPALREYAGMVLIDCGGLENETQLELLRQVDIAMFVLRPSAEDGHQIQYWINRTRAEEDLRHLCAVQVGAAGTSWWRSRKGFHPSEVEEALGIPVLGVVADDARVAQLVGAGQCASRQIRTSPLVRSVDALFDTISNLGPKEVDHVVAS